MKKRMIALSLALLLALTACGKEQAPAPAEDENAQTQEEQVPQQPETPEEEGEEQQTQEAPAEEADPDSQEPSAQPEEQQPETPAQPETPKPQEPAQPEASEPQKPEQTDPAEQPQPPQTPAQQPDQGEDAEKDGSVDLTAFYESLVSGQKLPAMMLTEGEALETYYSGLSSISTNQCSVYMTMISAAVGELALVEVQDAADVEAVKEIFQARIDYQVGDDENPGGAWYPGSIESWKNDSRIVSNGNCVMLVACEGADDVVAAFNALFAA